MSTVTTTARPGLVRPRRGRIGQLLRYGAVSVIATATSMTVLGALVATRTVTPGWANVVATAVGTVPSFELNRRWVWGRTDARRLLAQAGPFCALSFAGLALSTASVSAAGRWATSAALSGPARTVAVEAASVAAFGLLWIAQFVILDRLLFGRRRAGEGASPAARVPVVASGRPGPEPGRPAGPMLDAA